MSTETVPIQPVNIKRVTTQTLQEMKAAGQPIAMLTAYDYTLARLLDRAGADVLLVGDSASNVMAGHETTLPITLDQMIVHAQAVVRGAKRALVVVDLPFGSYQVSPRLALEAAVRIMKETGGHAVKLEGGAAMLETVRRIVDAGIPVMGHLGLTPQSIYKFGTYKVRAQDDDEANVLRRDALALQDAGVFALVLEKIPATLGAEVSQSLVVPTIGIGAGNGCDGQVLVTHDALGLTVDFNPRFVRRYAQLGETIDAAVKQYVEDVRARDFPSDDESY
ncbi:MAG: 3-methyl-2-oxobutanoate hydroxymethyltransferase [Rhodothermales bacterium]|nr:3-methyl-2-oxobutanoate hydroxymethyltransferase [Rhodothermales bacterium]MCA0269631.1 3-methyl-2-oxobutanoate hydroxymethyltransferase [Bacteroidota bacterium]